jgi:hypothetical protein
VEKFAAVCRRAATEQENRPPSLENLRAMICRTVICKTSAIGAAYL